MFRALVITAVLAVTAAVVSPAAVADGPTRVDDLVFPPLTGPFCAQFDVRVETDNVSRSLLIFDDGALMIPGHHVLTLTNVETGNSLVVGSSGVDIVASDGTVTRAGRGVVFIPAGRPLPQGITLYIGRVVITPGVSIAHEGEAVDLCANLA